MESHLYSKLYQQEKTYWWSLARRSLVVKTLQRLSGKDSFRMILDAGCGTGALLDDLKSMSHTAGLDYGSEGLAFCRERSLHNLVRGSADELPFKDCAFDAVFSLDTIEHIKQDEQVIQEFYRVVAIGGYCLITVPAFPFLWSERDIRLHHQRRYRKQELVKKVEKSGFQIIKCSYFSLFFFPILALLVLIRKRNQKVPKVDTDIAAVPQPMNRLFIAILTAESWLMRWINYPFGVSLFCVAQKPLPPPESSSQ